MKFNMTVFLLVVISVFFFSCSKEKSNEITNENNLNYLPHTDGAVWHYKDTTSQNGFTLKATDRVDTIDKIRFYIYENIPDDSPENTTYTRIGKAGDDYYINGFLPGLGDDNLLILKQNAAVGKTWKQKVAFGPDSTELIFEIKEKRITHVVLGMQYDKVIHVGISTKIAVGSSGSILTIPLGSLYYAAGVGIIQLDLNLQGQAPSVHLLLTDYSIP